MVCYHSSVKEQVLHVPPALLDAHGAVSEPVAKAMAEGARALLGCDIALSVTGVAGPEKDEHDNPVGLVFLGMATAEGTLVKKLQLGSTRRRIRTAASNEAFNFVRLLLEEKL